MKRFYPLVVLLLGSFMLSAQQTLTGTIMHDGIERDYRIRVPVVAEDASLVFNLHGFGSSAFEQELYSFMNTVADTAGFFVCYPDGLGTEQAWNVGWDFGSQADDVGFISALIDTLAATYSIDTNRVYSCGMSNGGFMSYRLACELNDRIAAVASVTGSMVPSYLPDCNPGKPVPVLEIHGTADDVVAYEGTFPISAPIPDVLDFWATNNGCATEPVEEAVPDTDMSDATTATRVSFPDCEDGQDVLHFRINGGGHTWPGSSIPIGVTNQDIVASAEIWHFFSQFTLDDVVNTTEELQAGPQVRVFPNPSSGPLYLDMKEVPRAVQLYDLSGRLLLRQEAFDSPQLDLGDLNTGVYLLEVYFPGGQRKTLKVIKKN
jgi:polyhydroxybutyrate depolymerase